MEEKAKKYVVYGTGVVAALLLLSGQAAIGLVLAVMVIGYTLLDRPADSGRFWLDAYVEFQKSVDRSCDSLGAVFGDVYLTAGNLGGKRIGERKLGKITGLATVRITPVLAAQAHYRKEKEAEDEAAVKSGTKALGLTDLKLKPDDVKRILKDNPLVGAMHGQLIIFRWVADSGKFVDSLVRKLPFVSGPKARYLLLGLDMFEGSPETAVYVKYPTLAAGTVFFDIPDFPEADSTKVNALIESIVEQQTLPLGWSNIARLINAASRSDSNMDKVGTLLEKAKEANNLHK